MIGAAAISGIVTAANLTAPRLRAQTSAPAPSFEVASVKANKADGPGSRIQIQPGGRFTVSNYSLRGLIQFAYQLQGFQIEGGPGWISSDRFDILAKAEGDPPPVPPGGPPSQMIVILRTLLADRFKLAMHKETRELPVYALVIARADGKLGPRLHQSSTDCQALMATRRGGPPPVAPAPGDRPLCGLRGGPASLTAGGFPLSGLAATVSQRVQRVVVDRTGLTGNFDFDLTWTPDQIPQELQRPDAPPSPPIDPNAPSIFTALQEQLGLRLDSQKGPVEVTVIDGVERPTED